MWRLIGKPARPRLRFDAERRADPCRTDLQRNNGEISAMFDMPSLAFVGRWSRTK
jgi:hypothetical protein